MNKKKYTKKRFFFIFWESGRQRTRAHEVGVDGLAFLVSDLRFAVDGDFFC